MYRLGEKPLWPTSPENGKVFRLTVLPSFSGSGTVTLTILPDGSGTLKSTFLDAPRSGKVRDLGSAVAPSDVSKFLARLDEAHFWDVPTQSEPRGVDGADWILEGVENAKYHVAVRWCPGSYHDSPQGAAFGAAANLLYKFAGRKKAPGC